MRAIDRAAATTAALLMGLAAACSGGGGGGGGGGPTVPQTGSIAGQVTAGGNGVQGVGISVAGGGSATTDASGGYRIDGVPTGSRNVTIALPAGMITGSVGESTTKSVTVAAGGTASVAWTLKPGRLVTAQDVSFAPATISVAPGTTVRWVSAGGTHTVTPDNPGQTGTWASTPLNAGAPFEHTFQAAGTYPYHCIPHQAGGMTGQVTVAP
jgi:plastocyanin